jgi:hypothetical protein
MMKRKQEKSKKNPRKKKNRKSYATSGDWKTPPLIAGS